MTDQEVVKQKWPDAVWGYANCGMGSSYQYVLACPDGPEIGRAYCGSMIEAPAWADAAKRIQEPGA